ncbi:hypothetical protein M2271_003552 [Streptomyces sp. LBL]|uniref:hypothetical protein n=1 Tax=Streptomyces sp. LBL TaxID=2940562 RepID=UPI002476D63A|nr:hypothetical protein [Streptomyces sp. LBL]MDH6625741.1 hypothetical protein [Streptomyces sp. LBL]
MSSSEVSRRTTGSAARVDVADPRQLELDDLRGDPEEALVARGAAYAREWARIENHPTILLRNVAVVVVALREKYDDYLGRDGEYRKAVADMYVRAGIDEARIKTSVRYHVNNLLRRTLTTRELTRLGLIPESALERQQDTRATNQAIINATKLTAAVEASPVKQVAARPAKKSSAKGELKADVVEQRSPGLRVKATADQLRLAEVAGGIVGQLRPEVIDVDMTDGQRAKLDEHLAAMEKTIRELRKHLKTRRSGR